MPEPVGAQISVFAPDEIAGQPRAWAGVGSANDASNQPRTGSEKGARGDFALCFRAVANRLTLPIGAHGLAAAAAGVLATATNVRGVKATDWEARLRESIEAFNRGDYESMMSLATADVELQRADVSPEARDVVRGRDAVLEFFRPDVFTDQRLELLGLAGSPPALIGHLRFTARGAGSGLPVEIEAWSVYRLEGDRFSRLEIYATEEDAQRAAGV